MKKPGTTITVTAKGDFGYHPGLKVDIVQDREYVIDETEFADQLFNRPAPDWKSPAEKEAEAQAAADKEKTGARKAAKTGDQSAP